MVRGVLSVLLREWRKFLFPSLAKPVRLGSRTHLMQSVTLTSLFGCDIYEVSFQTLASQLTRSQAASGARDAVRITPTFNYSCSLSTWIVTCPLLLSLPRGRDASSSGVLLTVRGAGASVLSSLCKMPAKEANLHREVKEKIKPLTPCPLAPTASIGSAQGPLVDARP